MKPIIMQPWKRAVVKVGSGLIAPGGKTFSVKHMLTIAGFITECRNQGKEIILVSSGAVAAGMSKLPKLQNSRNRSIPEKQALAAVGQAVLMAGWSRFFDFPCAQILLTYEDIHDRRRYVNAKTAIKTLLNMDVLPIVNENDTVATRELKVGDNDNLAAYVAMLAESQLLIIGTDIDGLYEADPRRRPDARLIPVVEKIDPSIYAMASGSGNPLATGGMKTKIEAAEKAVIRGIDTIILNSTSRKPFDRLLAGEAAGTLFRKSRHPMTAKKHWMLHALCPSGKVIVDSGAARAIRREGASLLPSGILAVEGGFEKGASVEVVAGDVRSFRCIAKGIVQYGSVELRRIQGRKSAEISNLLGYARGEAVIRRDELVVIDGD